jgi:hypothetical protein
MDQYDVSQVCLNGHITNDAIHLHSESNEEYCARCGEKTITQCPECSANIRGAKLIQLPRKRPQVCKYLTAAPAYCLNCGKPYPWTESKIVTAIQIFAEFGDLSEEEKGTIEQDITNVAKDIPQAELSAMRIKRIWEKYGKIAYNVIMEFASKTAAEVLKNS